MILVLVDNPIFILVRPQYLGNLGSVARVMKNFSLGGLRLVEAPKNYKDAEARKMSVGAFDVLKNACLFNTLEEALKDVSFSLGTTSGQQREFAPEPLHGFLPEIEKRLPGNKCAIVFGDEVNGLSREELQRCHHVVTIPTNPEFPALNIAQAVAITAYEIARLLNENAESTSTTAAQAPTAYSTAGADDRLFEELDRLLHEVEFSKKFNRAKVLSELRAFYQRAHPTERETDLLTGAVIRVNQKLN